MLRITSRVYYSEQVRAEVKTPLLYIHHSSTLSLIIAMWSYVSSTFLEFALVTPKNNPLNLLFLILVVNPTYVFAV